MDGETTEEWKARIGIGQASLVGQVVGGDGRTHTTVVLDETKPRVAGMQTEHWSGRQDATVFPERVKMRKTVQEMPR